MLGDSIFYFYLFLPLLFLIFLLLFLFFFHQILPNYFLFISLLHFLLAFPSHILSSVPLPRRCTTCQFCCTDICKISIYFFFDQFFFCGTVALAFTQYRYIYRSSFFVFERGSSKDMLMDILVCKSCVKVQECTACRLVH